MVLQHRHIFHALPGEDDDRFTTYTPQTVHSSQSFMYMLTDTFLNCCVTFQSRWYIFDLFQTQPERSLPRKWWNKPRHTLSREPKASDLCDFQQLQLVWKIISFLRGKKKLLKTQNIELFSSRWFYPEISDSKPRHPRKLLLWQHAGIYSEVSITGWK